MKIILFYIGKYSSISLTVFCILPEGRISEILLRIIRINENYGSKRKQQFLIKFNGLIKNGI